MWFPCFRRRLFFFSFNLHGIFHKNVMERSRIFQNMKFHRYQWQDCCPVIVTNSTIKYPSIFVANQAFSYSWDHSFGLHFIPSRSTPLCITNAGVIWSGQRWFPCFWQRLFSWVLVTSQIPHKIFWKITFVLPHLIPSISKSFCALLTLGDKM